MLILSGIVKIHLYPFTAATIARATPIFPEVGSMIVPPGFNNPFFSASSTTASAILSFTLLPGLDASSFAQTVAEIPAVIWFRRTSGVLPTASSTLAEIFISMSPEHEQLNDSLINSAQLTKVYYAVCRFAHRGGFFQPSGAINLQVCRYQLEARPIFTA